MSFPTSAARDEPLLPGPRLPPRLPDPPSPPPPPSSSYPTHVPPLRYVAPGVLDNGALTIAHPDVRLFLAEAHTVPPPSPPTHKPLFVLAALALFYHPKRPAHWLFWSRGKRAETAKIVQAVLNTPNLVHPPICWLGIPEHLNMVANLQHGWRGYLSDLAWFAPYAEPKRSSSPSSNRMTLRKRKQQSTSSSPPLQPAAPEQIEHAITTSVTPVVPEIVQAVDVGASAAEPPPQKRRRTCPADQQASVDTASSTQTKSRLNPTPQAPPVRCSERQKALRNTAKSAAPKEVPPASTPPTPLSTLPPDASRLPSCAPSDSSTVVMDDSSWPNIFLPSSSSTDPGSPSDLSAITMVEPIEDVDVKRDLMVACEEAEKRRMRKRTTAKTVPAPATLSRAAARRDTRTRKKAEAVTSSGKSQAKRDEMKRKAAAATTTNTAPTRSKKRARRRR